MIWEEFRTPPKFGCELPGPKDRVSGDLMKILFLFLAFFLHADPPKKVFFVSLPKAGTHMLIKAIELMQKERLRWIGLENSFHFSPLWDLSYSHKVTAGHLFPYPSIEKVRLEYSDSYTKILLIRDPRDIMVSFSHHLRKGMIWSSLPTFDYDRFVSLTSDEQLKETLFFPNQYLHPGVCFPLAVLWIQDPSVLVCRYEDLVGSQGGGSDEKQFEVLKRIALYMGCVLSDDEIRDIGVKMYGGTWTFRKGNIEGWRTAYSEENKALFKQLYGTYISAFGYGDADDW
ncbi:MAG: hypothetical protein KGJ02_06085 [Verrucomicrobiota bacterium]|nr:hypothetical protein [Verrucomicrobiota bacterium]